MFRKRHDDVIIGVFAERPVGDRSGLCVIIADSAAFYVVLARCADGDGDRDGRRTVSQSSDGAPRDDAAERDDIPGPLDPVLAQWAVGIASHVGDGAALPPHHLGCLGCGPDNPHGHHLLVRRSGEHVQSEHVFDERHMGAPGIAHGGAVATVLDDLYGFLLFVIRELAVTRSLEVEYLAPVRLGVTYALRAELVRREGRKLHVHATMIDASGRVIATSTALFMTVTVDHFSKAARNS